MTSAMLSQPLASALLSTALPPPTRPHPVPVATAWNEIIWVLPHTHTLVLCQTAWLVLNEQSLALVYSSFSQHHSII